MKLLSTDYYTNILFILLQILAAIFSALTHFAVGAIIAYPGVTLPALTDQNSTDIILTETDAALFSKCITRDSH